MGQNGRHIWAWKAGFLGQTCHNLHNIMRTFAECFSSLRKVWRTNLCWRKLHDGNTPNKLYNIRLRHIQRIPRTNNKRRTPYEHKWKHLLLQLDPNGTDRQLLGDAV